MSGMWKRSHGRTSEAPPDERGGYRYVRPTATAPHLDSTPSKKAPGAANTRPSARVGGAPGLRSSRSMPSPAYAFPGEVRRILYITNAIEALNSKLRRAVRARGHFPSDEAATKLLFLVLNRSENEWTMPPREST